MATEKVSAKKEKALDLTTMHGKKFGSFKDLAAAVGIKVKTKAEKGRKCPACGGAMDKIAGNVWVCNTVTLEDKKYKDKSGTEHEVQVFGPCCHRIIDNPYA